MHGLKGKIEMELLLFLIVIVITSAVVLFLVQSGIIAVKADNNDVSVLNAEFIPFAREGTLAIKEFQFCSFVTDDFNCFAEQNSFELGQEFYARFSVESDVESGEITLTRNYRITNEEGKVILELDKTKKFQFDWQSARKKEVVIFADRFIASDIFKPGKYFLETTIENPLLHTKISAKKEFTIIHNAPDEVY